MLLTQHAVKYLKAGAQTGNLDINAVEHGTDGLPVEYYANQFIWEEPSMQEFRCDFPEYQPVLEVIQIQWLGTYRQMPLIHVLVTDGSETMAMRVSMRNKHVRKGLLSKNGPIFRGRLNCLCRFKLLEYTTDTVTEKATGNEVPVIYLERMMAEPRKRNKKKEDRFINNHGLSTMKQASPKLQHDAY